MKILNLLWGFSTGGIGRCFLSYHKMSEVGTNVIVRSVCIDIRSRNCNRSPLLENGIDIIPIKNLGDFSWIKKVKACIDEAKPDLIFCHGFNGPVVVSVVKKLYNIRYPMVCTYHGSYHPPTPAKKLMAPVYNRLQRQLYRRAAQQIITVEDQSRYFLIKKGIPAHKLVTVPNGIPDDSPGTGHDKDLHDGVVRLCTISRLDAIKGLDYLIRAIAMTTEDVRKKIKLYLIGDGPEYNKLKSLSEDTGITDSICFTHYQSDVAAWLRKSDIFLLPSLSECHSISLLEAMRAGKAIIATEVGGNHQTIRHSTDGIIVPPANPAAIAKAVETLVLNRTLREELGNSARQRFLTHYTEATMLNNLINSLKSNN